MNDNIKNLNYQQKYILHCDMNNFYASVECMLNPTLKNHPVAVAGSIEDRHGIILARNYLAKPFGVGAGDTIWQAKNKCPNLVIVSPPNFYEYEKYSKLARKIYNRYSEFVEPYGMDECWVDITTLAKDFDDAERIANNIREDIKFELGLTISVGVSFNKVFAKLGSDMKKPDATTVITQENFQNKVWPLPASDLLGVGRATKKALDNYNIRTIGDLAKIDKNWMNIVFGKNGQRLSEYANGIDYSEVARFDEQSTVKSVGHGITTVKDLENNDEVWRVILELSQDIGFKLRRYKKRAKAVSISIRDNKLVTRQWQMQLKTSIQSSIMIAEATFELFKEKYDWTNPIRTVTITAIKLIEEDTVENLTFFTDIDAIEKVESVEKCIEKLNERFGDGIVKNATLLKEGNMPRLKPKLEMPTGMPQPRR